MPDPSTQIKRRIPRVPCESQPDLPQVFGGIELAASLVQRNVRDLVFGMQFAQVPGREPQEVSGLGGRKGSQILPCVRRKIALQMQANGRVQCRCVGLKLGKYSLC